MLLLNGNLKLSRVNLGGRMVSAAGTGNGKLDWKGKQLEMEHDNVEIENLPGGTGWRASDGRARCRSLTNKQVTLTLFFALTRC